MLHGRHPLHVPPPSFQQLLLVRSGDALSLCLERRRLHAHALRQTRSRRHRSIPLQQLRACSCPSDNRLARQRPPRPCLHLFGLRDCLRVGHLPPPGCTVRLSLLAVYVHRHHVSDPARAPRPALRELLRTGYEGRGTRDVLRIQPQPHYGRALPHFEGVCFCVFRCERWHQSTRSLRRTAHHVAREDVP